MRKLTETCEFGALLKLDKRLLPLAGMLIRSTTAGGLPVFQNTYWLRGTGGTSVKFVDGGNTYPEFIMADWHGVEAVTGSQIFKWMNGAVVVGDIRVNSAQKIEARVGTTIVATGANNFNQGARKYHYQVWLQQAASGFIKVKVDDATALEINYSGDTRNGQSVCDTFHYGSFDVNVPFQIDDLIFIDPTDNSDSAGETTWPGIPYFGGQAPDGAGSYDSQFDRNTGSSSRYTYVDDPPPVDDDATYLYSATVGHRQSVTTANFTLPANATPVALLNEWVVEQTGGGYQAKLFNKISADEDLGSAVAVGTTYEKVQFRRVKQPNGSAWDQSSYNSNEIGVEVA